MLVQYFHWLHQSITSKGLVNDAFVVSWLFLIIAWRLFHFGISSGINQGYHSIKNKSPGHEQGIINSWYYALEDRYDHMTQFWPVKQQFYAREFPTAWRLIDTGIGELVEQD